LINQLPFRLGTSSYIIPDDILPNVRYLANRVRDIELVLFELEDGPSNLPSAEVIAELKALAVQNDLTYTVHLPLDLRLGADGSEQHISLVKARRVIESVFPLDPWAYVLHLDGKEFQSIRFGDAAQPSLELRRWQEQSARALEIVSGWAGSPEHLVVENLEGYPLDFLEPVLDQFPVSRCVDVGHLWRDGQDPIPYLERTWDRTRVIHWHGMGTRDHQSLAHMLEEQIDPVLAWLLEKPYTGVVTLEVFSQEDLDSSMQVIAARLKNYRENHLG
jgi:sugar phosphate isomerase/epimerase